MAKRNEIDDKYKWDLTLIYKTNKEYDKDYKYVLDNLDKISSFKGKILKSAKNLYDLFELDEGLTRKIEKLYVYSNMTFDQDTSNSKSQELLGKIRNLYTKYSETVSFVNPELLTSDYSLINDYMKE